MTSNGAEAAIASLKDAGLGDVLHLPESQAYNDRTTSYWSLTAQLRPWAIVQPRTTEEVSKALTALVNTPDVKFAVRRLVIHEERLFLSLFLSPQSNQPCITVAATWPGLVPITSTMV